jgi:hypothetical protein
MSDAKTRREPEAEMRSLRAPAPKPAKTATWIAPIRTAASMTKIASGIVGM